MNTDRVQALFPASGRLPLRGAERRKLLLAFGLMLVFASVAATVPPFELRANRTSKPPVIDGIPDEAEWELASTVESFIQYEPQRGEPSGVRTQALLLYDSKHIYVAFRAWDPEPLTAQLTQRDTDLFRDDAVMVLLDTHHDRQTAYFFMTNLLGTQADGRVADDGRSVDRSWDAPWKSAAARTDFGWTAEFAIPLGSLKYAAGDAKTWGVNFYRSRRRSLEVSGWAGPLDSQMRVSQAGVLSGLNLAPPAKRHQVIPYALARAQQHVQDELDVGLDVRYALTPELSVYGTLYPDFATIEADQEEVNLTRFEVSLREKRQFFLEGQELFNQRIRTFYSRRIADISLGGKLLGKEGPWTLAFVTAQSEPLGRSTRANYTVGRAKRDVFGRSNIAVMAANRRFDGVDQGSAGLDATLFFTETFGMTAQLVKSYGPYGSGTMAYFIRPSYDSSTGHFHVRYTHLGDRFGDNANVIGFIRDDNRRELDSAAEKILWVRKGPLEKITYDSNYNAYWSQAGLLRSWQIDESVEFEFRNRLSVEADHTEEFKRFEKDFRNRQTGLRLGYNTREYQSVSTGFEFGRNFDSDYRLWTAEARYKVTSKLSAEYELQRLTLDPDPEEEGTWIHVVRANHFFTKDLFLRVFFQSNSSIDRRNLQAVFVYRYLPPFGTIQVAYQKGTAAFGRPSDQGHTLFFKVTTVF